jgi:hypothetical protein
VKKIAFSLSSSPNMLDIPRIFKPTDHRHGAYQVFLGTFWAGQQFPCFTIPAADFEILLDCPTTLVSLTDPLRLKRVFQSGP